MSDSLEFAEDADPDFTKSREKHLEMIQRVIERMATGSATTKRYCLVIIGGAIGVARLAHQTGAQLDKRTLLAAAAMTVVFWAFDARYLLHERWFRCVYEAARQQSPKMRPDYRMTPSSEEKQKANFRACLFSWSTVGLYGPMLFLLGLMAL